MPRYKLTVEYDGTAFFGWQRQAVEPTVQGVIEQAASKLNGAPTTAPGAGRTDSGVHALGQVAHLDMAKPWRADRLRDALNSYLRPHPVVILAAAEVASDFHARLSAIQRSYCYHIINRRAPLSVAMNRAWRVPVPLQADAMAAAARLLEGRHDFTTFRSTACQANSPVKTIDTVAVSQNGENIIIDIAARSFLHNQVRSIVGSLKLVGQGKWRAADLTDALNARDRTACGPVAPAAGLYLTKVDYDV